jgi:hypothetical protein
MNALSFSNAVLFLLIVFPGLISARVYRLVMPARELQWGDSILEGLFYSAINFVLGLPLMWWLLVGYEPLDHPARYLIAGILVLLVGPIAWPLVLVSVLRAKWVTRRIQAPFPSAWDFFFDRRRPVFALVHLSDGDIVAGYWGADSYAGSFPNDGDVYFEAVYSMNTGRPGSPVPFTRGMIIRKDQYRYIELLDLPPKEVAA